MEIGSSELVITKKRILLNKVINITEITIIVPFILIFIFGVILSPNFLTVSNWFGILRSASYVGLIAIPVTFLLSSKGLDLSAGTVVGLTAVLFSKFVVEYNVPFFLALLIVVAVASIIGFVNGFLCVNIGIPAFVVTLAMQFSVRGAAYVICQGYNISGIPEKITVYGNTRFLFNFVTIEMIALIILAIIADFILRRTAFGRKLLLVGTNDTAANLCAIKVKSIRRGAFMATSMVAAISGVLFTMRSGMGVPSAGTEWDMQAIIACVLGGTSIYGGKGSILGTILGVIFMALVLNIMLIAQISSSWQFVGLGGFMILGIVLDVARSRYLEGKI